MPIYEYQCEVCESIAEEFQTIGAKAPSCKRCGGVMRYKFSPIALIKMKGMGGYPSLRKAIQRGGGDLVSESERARADENRQRGFKDLSVQPWV